MTNSNPKVPKYQIIENDLIDKINNNFYNMDEPLPTEAELSDIYGCSRVTVRQALSNLAYKGYITKSQGSGSFVKRQKSITKSPKIKSFTEDMLEMGKTPSNVITSFNVTDAGKTIADILKIKPTDKIYYFERTRYADNIPMVFEKNFMAVDLHPELSMKVLQESKYKYGETHNLSIDYSVQEIDPIFPPAYIANELKIPTTQPILRVANTTYLKDGTVFDYSIMFMHPENYRLTVVKKK